MRAGRDNYGGRPDYGLHIAVFSASLFIGYLVGGKAVKVFVVACAATYAALTAIVHFVLGRSGVSRQRMAGSCRKDYEAILSLTVEEARKAVLEGMARDKSATIETDSGPSEGLGQIQSLGPILRDFFREISRLEIANGIVERGSVKRSAVDSRFVHIGWQDPDHVELVSQEGMDWVAAVENDVPADDREWVVYPTIWHCLSSYLPGTGESIGVNSEPGGMKREHERP